MASTNQGLELSLTRLWVDTSSTAMSAQTTSVLKDLEHHNACVAARHVTISDFFTNRDYRLIAINRSAVS